MFNVHLCEIFVLFFQSASSHTSSLHSCQAHSILLRCRWAAATELDAQEKMMRKDIRDINKLASLEATLVRNYDRLTESLTHRRVVKCRATSVAKNHPVWYVNPGVNRLFISLDLVALMFIFLFICILLISLDLVALMVRSQACWRPCCCLSIPASEQLPSLLTIFSHLCVRSRFWYCAQINFLLIVHLSSSVSLSNVSEDVSEELSKGSAEILPYGRYGDIIW